MHVIFKDYFAEFCLRNATDSTESKYKRRANRGKVQF